MSKIEKKLDYKDKIKNHFNKLAPEREAWIKKSGAFYSEDIRCMKELIIPNSKVLEIGCGNGNLLASLSPSVGVGVDISKEMISKAKSKYKNLEFIEDDIEDTGCVKNLNKVFDFIIISDTIGYFKDIQKTLDMLHKVCNADTRIIVAYYSPFWEPILNLAARIKLKMPELTKALLNETDISSLLNSSKFETVKKQKKIIFPFKLFGVGRLVNRFLSCLPILSNLCIRNYVIARSLKAIAKDLPTSASVIIPCRNEKGNIKNALNRLPLFTKEIEVIFVEGHSQDGTWEEVNKVINDKNFIRKGFKMKAIQQQGVGKADAVFSAFKIASNDVLIILDGDLTVPPEDIPKFWKKISSGEGEYINGSRLIYPMENEAMRFLNYIANKMFSILFTWLLGQRYTDTLCGTKVIRKRHFDKACVRNKDLGDFDPFGDFFIIFGAARLNLKMIEVPIRYRAREYGETQISRFSHGFLLIKMVIFAFFKLKAT
jgi:ubiquinone/menaquinone biosynthesis C-methylase UbiE